VDVDVLKQRPPRPRPVHRNLTRVRHAADENIDLRVCPGR
jgi:hypothetical protein